MQARTIQWQSRICWLTQALQKVQRLVGFAKLQTQRSTLMDMNWTECRNQQPFTIFQTHRSLPADNYEIRVRTCYRDGETINSDMVARAKNGEGQNVFLFAATKNREETIWAVSVAAGEWTTPSFDHWWNAADDSDWLIYDDFEFHYLGNVIQDTIEGVEATIPIAPQPIFNFARQCLSTSQKSINIINSKKVYITIYLRKKLILSFPLSCSYLTSINRAP